jgi:hypothetical protein
MEVREIPEEGEDIGIPFSQTIKERYPASSKKRTSGSKGRGRLKGR